jgi:septum formation protein
MRYCRSSGCVGDRLLQASKSHAADQCLWLEPQPLVLASTSAIRLTLLRGAGIPTQAVASAVDELALIRDLPADTSPDTIASLLARAKATAVSRLHANRIVVGADQTLSLEGRLFTKAPNLRAALAQLALLSGRTHTLHSAIAIVRDGSLMAETVVQASLVMRPLSTPFLSRYIQAAGDSILSSVGCYQFEGLGVHLFERVIGDHNTILGLPLLALLHFLRRFGCVAE